MQIDFINNLGITNFNQQLESNFKTCSEFDVASAFVTKEGIRLLEYFQQINRSRKSSGRFITGFYNNFNSREDLLKLQSISKNSRGRIQIRVSKNTSFHWKYYNFSFPSKFNFYIGSSNFTHSGMKSKGELMAKLQFTYNSKNLKQKFTNEFNTAWANSVPITEIPLQNYKQNKQVSITSTKLDSEIRRILSQKKGSSPLKTKEYKVRAILLNDYLSKKTEKIISENNSEWDKKDYSYFCYSNKSEFETTKNASHLLVIEKYSGKFSFFLTQIRDHDTIKTPDGTYFIAYKSKTGKRETISIKEKLKNIGLNYRDRNFNEKHLGKKQIQKIIQLLK